MGADSFRFQFSHLKAQRLNALDGPLKPVICNPRIIDAIDNTGPILAGLFEHEHKSIF